VVRLYIGAALVFIVLVGLWLVQTHVVWGWGGSWWIDIPLAVLVAAWAGFRWWRRSEEDPE